MFVGCWYTSPYESSIEKDGDFPIEKEVRYAGYYNLTGTPILIDGNGDWAAATANDWCYFKNGFYFIENVTIDGLDADSCITIMNSDVPFIIRNCTLINSNYHWAGIHLSIVENGEVTNNNCSYNNGNGIRADSSQSTIISNNLVSHNAEFGIFTVEDTLDEIYGNTAFGNGQPGIELQRSNHTNVFNNEIYNQPNRNGISLNRGGVTYNKVFNNTIYNVWFGISIANEYNEITLNDIRDCDVGISTSNVITGAGYNNITRNTIVGNNRGIYESYGSNLFYLNYLDNTENVYESTTELNYWDNGSIGNYYSDYSGKDTNDDGIGDSVYDIPGGPGNQGQDNYPIWWDAPMISIILPNVTKTFENAPSYEISVDEGIADIMWYTIDHGITNITFTSLIGFINETAWDSASEGPITIIFYTNDSRGYIGKAEVQIIKEIDQGSLGPAIPGYHMYLLLGTISIISLVYIKKRKRK